MEITLNLRVDISEKADMALKRLLYVMAGGGKAAKQAPGQPVSQDQEPQAEEAPAEEPQGQEPQTEEAPAAEVTDEELRQHMDMTISKFAGNGWKDSTDARTTAIRKGCTKAFKEIAKWLGAEKPTALDQEKRHEFVKRLEEVFIEEKGEGKVPEIEFRPF